MSIEHTSENTVVENVALISGWFISLLIWQYKLLNMSADTAPIHVQVRALQTLAQQPWKPRLLR